MRDLPGKPSLIIHAIWACLSLLAVLGNMHYLRGVWDLEWEASFLRAEAATELTEQALLRSADGIESVLDFAQTRVELASEGAVEASAALDRRLQEIIVEQRFGIRGVAWVRLDGIIGWTPSGELMGTPATEQSYFQELGQRSDSEIHFSAPFRTRSAGRWLVTAARVMREEAHRPTGIIVVGFDPLHLGEALSAVAGGSMRSLTVRQISNGRVRASSNDIEARLAQGPAPEHPIVQAARQSDRGRLQHLSPSRHVPVISAYRAVREHNLVVYAAFDQALEMAGFWRIARPAIAGALIYLIGSLLVAIVWDRNARLRRRLQELATLDPLTGLYNRRALNERMRDIRLGKPGGVHSYACLLFDIDHFKAINDRFGHARGDEVLKEVASLLRSEVRGGDTVCRWGGEEMLVVLRHCDRGKALTRAEALRGAIEALYEDSGSGLNRVTASVGVACFPHDGDTLDAVTASADSALYRAKRAGRNRVAMVALAEA